MDQILCWTENFPIAKARDANAHSRLEMQCLFLCQKHIIKWHSFVQSGSSSSSSDGEDMRDEIKKQYKMIREEKFQERKLERQQERLGLSEPRFLALKPGQKFQMFKPKNDDDGDGNQVPKKKLAKYYFLSPKFKRIKVFLIIAILRASLGDRLQLDEDVGRVKLAPSAGSREMTFTLQQSQRVLKAREDAKQHHEERRKIIRSANHLKTRGGRGRGRGRGRF